MTMITRPKLMATPTCPNAPVLASTMIAPQPANTSAKVPIASASRQRRIGRFTSSSPQRRSSRYRNHSPHSWNRPLHGPIPRTWHAPARGAHRQRTSATHSLHLNDCAELLDRVRAEREVGPLAALLSLE